MSYDPELYDLFHDDHGPDVRWYLEQAEIAGGPVLELGAGTGRTALPIARAGLEIWALEPDPEMRRVCQGRLEAEPPEVRARARLLAGDMRSFSLPARFGLVQIPFRAFLHNTSREEQRACLDRCLEHLRPGGALTLNIFHPSLQVMSENHGPHTGRWRWVDEREVEDGGFIVLSEANVFSPVIQQVSSRHRYERFDAKGALVSVHMHRLELAYLYPGDLRALLAEAGFEEVEIWGGFEGQPLVVDGQEVVARAIRP